VDTELLTCSTPRGLARSWWPGRAPSPQGPASPSPAWPLTGRFWFPPGSRRWLDVGASPPRLQPARSTGVGIYW